MMAIVLHEHPASGGPGIEPRWTRSDKDGVGTAYSALSRVWFTVSKGILNEVYYPTVDRPQIRDLQYLITRRGNLLPRRTPSGQHPRVPGPGRAGLSNHQCRSRGSLPHHQGSHRRSPSGLCARPHPPGGRRRPARQAAALRVARAAPGSRRPGQQRERGGDQLGEGADGAQGRHLARAGSLGPVLAMLLRLCGHDRRLARPGPRSSAWTGSSTVRPMATSP